MAYKVLALRGLDMTWDEKFSRLYKPRVASIGIVLLLVGVRYAFLVRSENPLRVLDLMGAVVSFFGAGWFFYMAYLYRKSYARDACNCTCQSNPANQRDFALKFVSARSHL